MRIQYLSSAAALSLTVLLSAYGVSSSNTAANSSAAGASAKAQPSAAPAEGDITPEEAARLAKQATFGPTPELIDAIVAKKTAASWVDEQLTLSESTYADLAQKSVPANYCSKLSGQPLDDCISVNFSATPMQVRFYSNAMNKNDQLRQRVAFALSQIVVASDSEVHKAAGLAAFDQILLSNAFGNYRDIVRDVTLSGYMGAYLNMADSNKSHPNENYARELMQLFSIGTALMNPDGTPQTDSTGTTIAAYTNNDVREVARALTGWTWARINNAPITDDNSRDWSKPMVMVESRFDTGQKIFLGKTVPAGATQQANVEAVIDALFNHPNTGPYICKRLIQQLTIADPTPAYVGRVAAVFANNGDSVRGDLKAVVRAIYLDTEARAASQRPGKVKEPVLLATSLARAIGHKSDGGSFVFRDANMGQSPFRAPSVFGFYPYENPLPQGRGLISPVSKLMTTSTTINRHNFVFDWTINGDLERGEFKPQPTTPDATGTFANWGTWENNGADDGKTIDRINLVMLNGTMTPPQRQSLLSAMAAIKNNDIRIQARKRAQMALYVVASSPLFQVDR